MNDKLKYNIKINQNNKKNTLDLQLFSSVSNPYTFTLDGNYSVSASIEEDLLDLSYYASRNIANYYGITEIPKKHLDYLNSGLCPGNMKSMFDGCKKLQIIPKLNIDTSKVTNMGSMFGSSPYNSYEGCESLTSVDLSNFDTSNVTDMGDMFYYCKNLTTIKGTIDMKSCTNYSYMFNFCSKLKGVKIKNPPSGFNGAGLSSSQYTIVS